MTITKKGNFSQTWASVITNPEYWISLNRVSRKSLEVVSFEVGQKELIDFNEEEIS